MISVSHKTVERTPLTPKGRILVYLRLVGFSFDTFGTFESSRTSEDRLNCLSDTTVPLSPCRGGGVYFECPHSNVRMFSHSFVAPSDVHLHVLSYVAMCTKTSPFGRF